MIAATLFDAAPGRAPCPFAAIPALPAPHDDATRDSDAAFAWLYGDAPPPLGYAVRAGALETADEGDFAEIGSQVVEAPAVALETYGARAPVKPDPDDLDWLTGTARALRPTAPGPEKAASFMAEALRTTLIKLEPGNADALRAGGAEVRFDDQAVTAIRAALAAERAFLEDAPDDVTGPPQILLGTPAPRGDLSGPLVLDRAAHVHLLGNVPLLAALRLAVTEFRCSQAVRVTGIDATLTVDARFDATPAAPLERLTQPITRPN